MVDGTRKILVAYDPTNDKLIPVIVDDEGRLEMSIVISRLDDIGDVSVLSPTDLYILYWNDTNGAWECRAITDWDLDADKLVSGTVADARIASTIARDSEVTADIAAHAAVAAAHHTKTTSAAELTSGELAIARLKASIKTATITFIIDGGGSAITTGEKGHLRIPFACTINRVTLLADQSGSIVIDIWKDTYANFPPTDADSITASAPPTISSAQKAEDDTLSGWTTAIAADDILAFNVDSISTVTRVTLSLKVTKT